MLKHRSDYQTPSCNVLAADLDICIFEDRTLVTTVLKLERTVYKQKQYERRLYLVAAWAKQYGQLGNLENYFRRHGVE